MIIKPANTRPTQPKIIDCISELPQYFGDSGPTYIDFETTGLDVKAEDFRAVGVGIASSLCPEGVYVELPQASAEGMSDLVSRLYEQNLVGYNIGFDAKVLHRLALDVGYSPRRWPWIGDTMILYKLTDNRGNKGQSWSLKTAQTEVLGWKETNEVHLDKWLIDNGYYRNSGGKKKPIKGEMWRAPVDILGHYCGLDVVSTMQLDLHLHKTNHMFPELMSLYEREFMTLTRLVNEQFWHGLYVNQERLQEYLDNLNVRIEENMNKFLYQSAATKHINEYNEAQVQAIADLEPGMFTKIGKVTARYRKWQQKMEEARDTNHFNASSKQQLRWLFYERLFRLDNIKIKTNWKGEQITKFNTVTKKEWVVWEADIMDGDTCLMTVEGKAYHGEPPVFSVDKEVLVKLDCDASQILAEYNDLIKERGYVTAMLDSLQADSTHPTSLRVHGTVTGRCSGGGYSGHSVNIQQIPKKAGYLENLTARPDHKLVQFDFSALEPVVLTELSEDSAMWEVYGKGIANDIYLFVGSRLGPLAAGLTSHGYDPLAPTPEAIKATKKHAKNLRGVAKVIHLAASYGAGPAKIWRTLTNLGHSTTRPEAKDMLADYWELFSGVKEYESRLGAEWSAQHGWFLNGRDRPMSVPPKYEKDILNRSIQSTGHDNLLTFLYHLDRVRTENNLGFKFIVCDFHDETVTECHKDEAEATVEAVFEALRRTNEDLGGNIALTGEPEVCDCFAEFKVEGYNK